MDNDIRKLIDDNWEDIKELIVKKIEAEQKPKTYGILIQMTAIVTITLMKLDI